MPRVRTPSLSPAALRAGIGRRSLALPETPSLEVGYSRTPGVLYAQGEDRTHGNFLTASYRRILADPAWARRLDKTYTGSRHLPRAGDRWRGELECASSSDALLMNIFCYPGVLHRAALCQCLDVEPGLRPQFGVRAELAMRRGETDRTELDMRLGGTLVEAKLTESGFGHASRERLLRYAGVEEVFDLATLPHGPSGYGGYQLVRGMLAALAQGGSYLVLLDARRSDLIELCYRTLSAAQSAEIRQSFRLRTWQELAGSLPPRLRGFLRERYAILPA